MTNQPPGGPRGFFRTPKVTSDCGQLPRIATRCSKSTQDRSSSLGPDAEMRRGFIKIIRMQAF